MNDKIKELAKRAGFYFYDMHDVDGQDLGETIEADSWSVAEKFAELIVRECIRVVQYDIIRNGSTPENERSWKHVAALKQHFGVEE